MTEQKRNINNPNKYIGVEGVFYKKEGQSSFRTVKKSITLKIGRDFPITVNETLKRKARALRLDFAGISDVFNVAGRLGHKTFLGRTAYYDFNNVKKANELLGDINYKDFESDSSIFFVSLVYFVKDKPAKDSFSLVYNVGIRARGNRLKDVIVQQGKSESTKRAIVKYSLDIKDTKDIHFIGVRWIEKIGSNNLFDSSEAFFKKKKYVLKEVEPMRNIKKKLLHLLENDKRLLEKTGGKR